MDDCKLSKVRKKTKKRTTISSHHVQNIDISHCSNCLIQVGLNSNSEFKFARKKKIMTAASFHVENFNVSNCPRSLIQVGRFSGNEFNFVAKSLSMSSWSREQVRCWLMNITLPSYVVNQMYYEGINGVMLKIYKKTHLRKDFLLKKSYLRLILYLRKSWLKMERFNFYESNSSYASENVVVPAFSTRDVVKENIQDILLHLKLNLKPFHDSFTELDISDLNYSVRRDLLVQSTSQDSFFVEILNVGKIIVGFINVPPDKFSDGFVEELREVLRKIKDTGQVSYILGDFKLNGSSRKLLLYEKNIIGVLTDHLFFRLRTERAFVKNSTSFYEVITNDTSVFSSNDEG